MGWTNVHPNSQNGSKNYLTSIPSDEGLGTENPGGFGIWANFAIFRVLLFFQNPEFFCVFVQKIFIFL